MSDENKIWLSSPHMGGAELDYVRQAFESNWIAPLGPQLDAFEKELAAYLGAKAAAALSSGTAALHLALLLLGVSPGDRVLVSSFTFVASASPIKYCGAEPVFVDSESSTWNMSPVHLESAIKSCVKQGKKPKAAVLVDLYGMPCSFRELQAVCEKYDIPIIEDAAEGLGSSYAGRKLGTFGVLGVLSFNGNKMITTSGGGALVSDDSELLARAQFLATQARDSAPHYQHSVIGYNYRMSNILAAIGRGQLEVLDSHVAARRANYQFYLDNLAKRDGISMLAEPEASISNRWLSCILVDPTKTGGKSAEDVRLHLEQHNVESRPLWKPLHLQPVFAENQYFGDGTCEELFAEGLCLPSGSSLREEDLGRISTLILNYLD